MLPKLVIFDLDGTLLNTVEDVADCFNQALTENNFPKRSLDEVISLVGGDLETIIEKLLPYGEATPEAIDLVKTAYRAIYSASSKPKTHPYNGIPELLGELQNEGIGLAVNTNKGQDLAEECLEAQLPDIQMPIVGYTNSMPPKPNPMGAMNLLKRFNCSPSEAVYIGDGISDALTAKNACIQFVYCAWGQGNEKQIQSSVSDMLIARNVAQLKDILLKR